MSFCCWLNWFAMKKFKRAGLRLTQAHVAVRTDWEFDSKPNPTQPNPDLEPKSLIHANYIY